MIRFSPGLSLLSLWRAGDWQPGSTLGGKYKVLEVLGSGSSGTTFKVPLASNLPEAFLPTERDTAANYLSKIIQTG